MTQETLPKSNIQKKANFKSNRRLILLLTCGVIFMFGFSYLLVPIFTFACKQLGINGKNALAPTVARPGMEADLSRTIKVEFTANVHGNFNFKFIPLTRHITIHPGEHKLIYFYAENKTGEEKTPLQFSLKNNRVYVRLRGDRYWLRFSKTQQGD